MAGQGRGTARSVEEDLFEGPRGFDFFQAVRLLELSRPAGAPRLGELREGVHANQEPVRLRASVDMAFAPADVLALSRAGAQGGPPELTVSAPALAGARGPLPLPVAQWVRDRERRGDTGPRDFLDLFHHRLLTLRYRARLARRLALEPCEPEKHTVASWLFSLMGMGTGHLRERYQVTLPDRLLLRYAGVLARRPRSMRALEAVLGDFFGVEVKGRSFVGAWLPLDEEQQTVLGRQGRNQRLGEAVLGRRVWDWQARFGLTLGPLSEEQFRAFLPSGPGLAALCELVRFMVGPNMDFHLTLVVDRQEVSPARLGSARLGWSSWLPTFRHDARGRPVGLTYRHEHGRVTLSARHSRPTPRDAP